MFAHLTLWPDDIPRDGPLNMAIDETLLLTSTEPVLRVYRWSGPWVSFGCFVPCGDARTAFPGRPLVRRWTGGGIVDHRADWTYALIIPGRHPLAARNTASRYHDIHEALVTALSAVNIQATLADAPLPGLGGQCFHQPVRADVLCAGKKIAGAAQRRTRHGLLHQGSVQGVPMPEGSIQALATALCPTAHQCSDFADVLHAAAALAVDKYASEPWLEKL
jgi:lipoate-protein ligase A